MDPNVYRAALKGSYARLGSYESWRRQVTPKRNTVLHIHLGKPVAKERIDIAFIQHVLDEEAKNEGGYLILWHENADGDIPLHVAARFGHADAVGELLARAREVGVADEGQTMLMKTNNSEDTALHEAARGGHDQVVEKLVEADPGCPYQPNHLNETPLYLAAESARGPETVRAILRNCSSSSSLLSYTHKGPCGRTVLHAFVRWNPLPSAMRVIRTILSKAEESAIRVQDDEGSTPVHHAAEGNRAQTLGSLLKHDKTMTTTPPESVTYMQDNEGRTSIHIAVMQLNWKCIYKLIAHRPDCIEIVDNREQNILHYAAKWGCKQKLNRLQRLLGPDFSRLMNYKDLDGNTPLHVFAANLLVINCGCVSYGRAFLIRRNGNVSLYNKENRTPLDILASHHYEQKTMANLVALRSGRVAPKTKLEIQRVIAHGKNSTEDITARFKKAAESWLVVAALVATVSFTAGLTIPGGFNQNPEDPENIGTAVLTKKTAFKAFFVSNTIALTSSCIAILLFFISASYRGQLRVFLLPVKWAATLTVGSIGAMMVAFVTGVYAVVPHSTDLHTALFVVSAFLFFVYAWLAISGLMVFVGYRPPCPGTRSPRL